MALKATIFKVDMAIADLNRHYYENHNLTLARHPSENDERMMARLLAFALNSGPELTFTKGLSTDDEPDLWQKHLHGGIAQWIELGNPTEKRLRQAAGKSDSVKVYCYGGNSSEIWWRQTAPKVSTLSQVEVINFPDAAVAELAGLAQRAMALQITIQDHDILVSNGQQSVDITTERWQ